MLNKDHRRRSRTLYGLDPRLGRARQTRSVSNRSSESVCECPGCDACRRQLTIATQNFEMDPAAVRSYSYPVKLVASFFLTVPTAYRYGFHHPTHIFEPFFSTKEKGKGTVWACRRFYGIVKQSGGYIDVSSEPGHGAAFKIYLPRVDYEWPRTLAVRNRLFHSAHETILVVEDEASLRKLTRSLLQPLATPCGRQRWNAEA